MLVSGSCLLIVLALLVASGLLALGGCNNGLPQKS
jgi:hypothetical protein